MFRLKKKDPRYIFKIEGNEKLETPAICVFKRFPGKFEKFTAIDELKFEDIDFNFARLADSDPLKLEIAQKAFMREFSNKYIAQVFKNSAMQIDYKLFAGECIDGFENFSVEGRDIKTVDDLLSLPIEYSQGVEELLVDCYNYATSREMFSQKN